MATRVALCVCALSLSASATRAAAQTARVDFQTAAVEVRPSELPPGPAEAWVEIPKPREGPFFVEPAFALDTRVELEMPAGGTQKIRFWLDRGLVEGAVLHLKGSDGALHERKLRVEEIEQVSRGAALKFAGNAQEAQAFAAATRSTPQLVPPSPPDLEGQDDSTVPIWFWMDSGLVAERDWLAAVGAGALVVFIGPPESSPLRAYRSGEAVLFGLGKALWEPAIEARLTNDVDLLQSGDSGGPVARAARDHSIEEPPLVGLRGTLAGLAIPVLAVILLGIWAGRRPRRAMLLWIAIPLTALADGGVLTLVSRAEPEERAVVRAWRLVSPPGDGLLVLNLAAQVDGSLEVAFELPFAHGRPVELSRTSAFGSPFAAVPPHAELDLDERRHRLRISRIGVPRRGQANLAVEEIARGVSVPQLSAGPQGPELVNATDTAFGPTLLCVGGKWTFLDRLEVGERIEPDGRGLPDDRKELWSRAGFDPLIRALTYGEGRDCRPGQDLKMTYVIAASAPLAPGTTGATVGPAFRSAETEVRVVIGQLPERAP